MSTDDITPRLAAMRDDLVSTVERQGGHRRIARPTAIAVIVAFVVGGALTGGLTAAAASNSGESSALEQGLATAGRYSAVEVNHGRLVGSPTFRIASGSSTVTLGARPAAADTVVVAFQCIEPGEFTQSLNGTETGSATPCGTSDASAPSTRVPDAQSYRVGKTGTVTYSIAGTNAARYAVWASWATSPAIAQASAQQLDEIADGKISLAEYTIAFNRFQACMAQAGYPQAVVPLVDNRYNYGYSTAASAVYDTQCYPREFEQVDSLWQSAHPE